MNETALDLVASIAGRQHSVVAHPQLLDGGLSGEDVRYLVRARRLERTAARKVFRIPGSQRNWFQDLWVAVLAGPPGTLVSHTSAAALHGLVEPPGTPHVTVGRTASGRFQGAVVHHAKLGPADRCWVADVPATAVPRTIVDCAAIFGQKALDALVDAAIGRRLTSMQKIQRAAKRAGPVEGGSRLTQALEPFGGGTATDSVKESHVLRLFKKWGLPEPVCQYTIRDARGRFVARVDFAWPAWRFGLEYDGDEFHPPRSWAADDAREARIEMLGWHIERADRHDLRPSSTRLRALLTQRLATPA